MTTCLKTVNVNGELLLAVDPSQTNFSACTYVVEDGANTGFNAMWNMTPAEALTISTSIAFLWALAWGFRAVARVLNDAGEQHASE